MSAATHFRFLAFLALAPLMAACSLHRVDIKSPPSRDAALQTVLTAYQETVRQAQADREYSWNNGRIGNMLVNLDADNNRGLCFHWQKLVYLGIQKALRESGWKATGIAINEGSIFEHHAVLVYHPDRRRLDTILKNSDKSSLYVLDPWSSGEARTYLLDDWLQLPLTTTKPARLTVIDTEPVYPASL